MDIIAYVALAPLMVALSTFEDMSRITELYTMWIGNTICAYSFKQNTAPLNRIVKTLFYLIFMLLLLFGTALVQETQEDTIVLLYVIISCIVWKFSLRDTVLQRIINVINNILTTYQNDEIPNTDVWRLFCHAFINFYPPYLFNLYADVFTLNENFLRVVSTMLWCQICLYILYIIEFNMVDCSVLRWKSFNQLYTDIAAASLSIFAIKHFKEFESTDRLHNKHELSDLLPLCINFHDNLSITWNYLLVLIENNVKRILNVLRQYYDLKKFLLYFRVVVISSVIFTLGLVVSFSYVSSWVDSPEVVINVNKNNTLFKDYRHICLNDSHIYVRHLNEDSHFNCDLKKLFVKGKGTEERMCNVSWYHNNQLIDPSHSDRIQLNKDNSILTIHFINSSDFGEYKCFVNGEHFNTFLLQQTEEPSSKYYYVDKGSLLYFNTHSFATLGDIYDISVEYTVNGIDVHDLCNSAILSCSPLSFIVKELDETQFENIIDLIYETDATYLFLIINTQTCVCGNMYGLHEIKIYKEYYNRTTGNNVIVEFDFPIKYYFFPKDNDSTVYDELYKSNLPYHYIQRMLNKSDEVIIPSVFWIPQITLHVAFIVNIIVFFVLYIILLLLMRLLAYLLTLYCRITIVPFRDKILFGYYFVPCIPPADKPLAGIEKNYTIHYDVYISSCDEDNDKALSLVTYLETNCGFKVCFPVRDLADEGNCSYFHSFTKATEQCRMFIVVLSRDYLEDVMCNNVQLMSCIMPLIHSSRRQARDLVILKLDRDIDIPIQISLYPDVTIINYTSDNDEIEVKRKLRRILVTERFS